MSTHVAEIVELIENASLKDVTLVGASYGANVITGVVEACPDKVKCMVYLDGPLPVKQDGAEWNCNFMNLAPEIRDIVRGMAKEHGEGWLVPPFPPEGVGHETGSVDAKLLLEMCTPQPLATLEEAVRIQGHYAHVERKVFVVTEKFHGVHAVFDSLLDDPSWEKHRLNTHHDAMLSIPSDVAAIICGGVASSDGQVRMWGY